MTFKEIMACEGYDCPDAIAVNSSMLMGPTSFLLSDLKLDPWFIS